MKRGLTKSLLLLSMLMILSAAVLAAGELSITVDRLNYWDAESHTFTVSNSGNTTTTLNYTVPSGWSWVSGVGCDNSGSDINCTVVNGSTATFTLTSSATDVEYHTTTFSATDISNGYTEANTVTLLRINPGEIFHTLVEYGRGRGNYLYDSGSGRSGSGKSAEGCTYLPNGTMFELNFLHKVQNIQQYLGLPAAEGQNATFSCVYNHNLTLVRKHLITSITRGTNWTIDYRLPEISSSWERMGFVGMDYDSGELANGSQIIVNCSSLNYSLPDAYGNVIVDEDNFAFTITDRNPFTVTASVGAGTVIGNGTQEVEITYTITNTAPLTLDNVIIEIEAPQYARFIGTRGELWGTALDQYRIEKIDLPAGGSEVITLVARFDTTLASGDYINATQGVKVSFVPCWEANAYNPTEFIQNLKPGNGGPGGGPIGNITFNSTYNSSIINIITYITNIYNIVTAINITITNIENTVNLINITVGDINTTVGAINITVTTISETVNNINTTVNNIQENVSLIYNITQNIYNQLNCSGVGESPICQYLRDINGSIYNLTITINGMNQTLYDLNQSFYYMNQTFTNYLVDINSTLYNLSLKCENLSGFIQNMSIMISNLVNCTYNDGNYSMICQYLQQINETTSIINGTVTLINTTVTDINNTVNLMNLTINDINSTLYDFFNWMNVTIWGNLTAQDLLDAINNISINIGNMTFDTTLILEKLTRIQEFESELVFLVTDSIVLQREANVAVNKGDFVTAAQKLSEANANLKQVTNTLIEREKTIRTGEAGASNVSISIGTGWWLPTLIVIMIVVLGVYLFSRPKEPYSYPPEQPPKEY